MAASPIAPPGQRNGNGQAPRGPFVLVAALVAALIGFAANSIHSTPAQPLARIVEPTTPPSTVELTPPAPEPDPVPCPLPLEYAQAFPPGCAMPTVGPSFGITFSGMVSGVPTHERFSTDVAATASNVVGAPSGPPLCELQILGGVTTASDCAFGPGTYRLFLINSRELLQGSGSFGAQPLSCVASPAVVSVSPGEPSVVTIRCVSR